MPNDLLTAEPVALPAPASDAVALMQVISRAASDPAVDVDKLERLLGMYERIKAQGARAAYTAALATMQPLLPVINERGRIEVRAKDGQGQRSGAVQQSTSYEIPASHFVRAKLALEAKKKAAHK